MTSFSKLVEGLPIQGTFKYTGNFSGPNWFLDRSGKLSDFLGDLGVDDVFRKANCLVIFS